MKRTRAEGGGRLALIIAAALVIASGGMAMEVSLFLRTAKSATATVASIRRETQFVKGREVSQYHLVVRFQDSAGENRKFEIVTDSPHQVESTVPILYSPSHPNDVRIAGTKLWDLSFGLIALATFLAMFGLLLIFVARRATAAGIPLKS